jgi:hypothetical protein
MATPDPDEIAFSDFMAARWSPLFRTAYLITGDRHEAEDLLVDDAMIRRTEVSSDARLFAVSADGVPCRTRSTATGVTGST